MSSRSLVTLLFDDTDKKFTQKRNIFTYVILSSFLLFSSFLLASFPCFYIKFSSAFTILIFPNRIFQYIRKNYYLFLLDYCYMLNIALIYLAFTNITSLSIGVLLASSFYLIINVYRYANSLTYSNFEIFTTCYMHINPSIALVAQYISKCESFETSFTVLWIHSVKWYTFYAALYFPLIFFVLKPFWTKYKIVNLFSFHAETPFYRDLFARMPYWGPPVYMFGLQFSMVTASTIIAYIGMKYTSVLIGICSLIVVYTNYRAASYYLDYIPAAAVRQAVKEANTKS